MTAALVTDRTAIADVIAAGLGELDSLRTQRDDADTRVEEAQQEADRAASEYAAKIDEVLATGWATAEGLAAQGHHPPKARRAAKTRKAADPDPTA